MPVTCAVTACAPSGRSNSLCVSASSTVISLTYSALPSAFQRSRSASNASLLSRFKCVDRGCVLFEERVILFQTEGGIFNAQLEAASNKVPAQLEQFALAHGIEADLIEETQEPGLPIDEIGGLAIPIPHLHGTSNELITARAFHAIDAEVCSTYAHRVFRCPCPGRVVLGGDQAMAWVHGRCHGCAQVNVAQSQDQVACLENDVLHLFDAAQPVYPADELNIARAPGGVVAYRLHIFLDRQPRRPIIPGQGEIHDTRRDFDVFHIRQFLFRRYQHIQ